jgi:hypothetical protein
MSRSKLRHSWSGLLAIGALALSAPHSATATKARNSSKSSMALIQYYDQLYYKILIGSHLSLQKTAGSEGASRY